MRVDMDIMSMREVTKVSTFVYSLKSTPICSNLKPSLNTPTNTSNLSQNHLASLPVNTQPSNLPHLQLIPLPLSFSPENKATPLVTMIDIKATRPMSITMKLNLKDVRLSIRGILRFKKLPKNNLVIRNSLESIIRPICRSVWPDRV